MSLFHLRDKEFSLGPIDLSLLPSETVALVGENGAGKSTFFQLLTGNLDPVSGHVKIGGATMSMNAYKLKQSIGYLPQNMGLPRWLSATEILSYAVKLFSLADANSQIEQALRYWDCKPFAQKPMASCSHGMQKRVGLALATIHEPTLLILDEPFSGLDLNHMTALRELILSRQNKGQATILCTHIAPYAARLCERAFLLRAGALSEFTSWQQLDYFNKIDLLESAFKPNQTS